ncbi:FkbM family methyltransferase [Gloeomargarita lithophora Alchichica-D10]|uniref:FkbM family methyltransferase n=1 Tax=Gloeomargarita lithophora Alchichica-D10 TaxID=1188229 RepID=A0A1J0AGH3_9CYAN|nr:FkbM family methyltransferase [Gloeomargarita lithophora]APB34987.1 FkbM family methyltransferase [Gloeomargarita lithophora Alchichica-D10]
MLLTKENRLQRKLKKWAWELFAKLEIIDSGGSDFNVNGEAKFISLMFGFYTKHTTNEPLIILDIGANQGQYSHTLSKIAERHQISTMIHLFEPLHECFSQIQLHLGENSNLIFNNFGISDQETTSTIFYDQAMSPLASLHQRKVEQYNIFMNQSQQIKLKRMDSYIQEKCIEHIHFVKLDVEGHELNALNGFGDYLNGSFIDFIQFEYGETYFDAHIRLLEIYQLLQKRDFQIAKITPNGLIPKRYYQYMENFIYANYVAISNRVLACQ